MSGQQSNRITYDRRLLLLGPKRNAVLDLEEVRRYGIDSYGDADYVSIYGLPPADWHAKGVRLLGRTVVECTRDVTANAIGRHIAATATSGDVKAGATVIDPFVGSGNTLFWILRHLPQARGLGYELDPQVFQLTRQDLAILQLPLDIVHEDYVTALRRLELPADHMLIAFIAPPWGEALSATEGLDLRFTSPPVGAIIDLFAKHFPNRMLFAIQVFERIVATSLAELTTRFDWSTLHIYDFNPPGMNPGLLLGTRGWRPRTPGGGSGPRRDPAHRAG